jgi:5-methylcytosine-specific restriction endonuclease McrA
MKTAKKCRHCKKSFRYHHSSKGIYCTNKCQQEYQKEQRRQRVKETGDLASGWVFPQKGKYYIIEEQGHKCSICGITEWMENKVPLILDHIDGNSDNWKLDNLRLVCGNCDMQLPTYKSRNIGNGRYYRRQRYKEGKSY